ncbi:MAG: hypothetical protein QM783_01290 [Phycisphaerales bacterium]
MRSSAVEGEEGLGEGEAAVAAVVERALEPLRRGGVVSVADEVHDEAGEAADALAAHGVALVGHCAGADLLVLEGLVELLAVGEEADVGGDFVKDARGGGEVGEDEGVDDAGVGLADELVRCTVVVFEIGGTLDFSNPSTFKEVDLLGIVTQECEE